MPAPHSRILGTGHYVPERVLTNQELEAKVDTSDEWIVTRTGIRERRIAAEGQTTSDMASAAAKNALEAAGLSATDLDLIVVATVTPDMQLPSTACFVQSKIGARRDCPSFDIAAACAGFIYGLDLADKFVRTGAAKNVLVVGVELLSRVMNWDDRTTCVLFGDGAGAAIVGGSDGERGLLSTHLYADGGFTQSLQIPGGGSAEPASATTLAEGRHTVHMIGKDIFKAAVKNLSSASKTALEQNGITADDVDWVVPHQANLRILGGVSDRVGIPLDRFYLNLERYGNTSSASIPIALDEGVRKGDIKPGQTLLMCALGGGVAWGSAAMRF